MDKDTQADGQQIEEYLKTNEATYRQIAASLPGIIYQLKITKEGSFSFPFISEGVYPILGYTLEEIRQDPELFLKFLMAGTPSSVERMFQAAQQSPHTLSLELKTTTKHRQTKWLRNIANPYPLDDGNILWNGVIIDITEQRSAQEALRQSEQRYREVFDHTSDAVFSVDVISEGQFRFGSYNAVASEIIGQQPHAKPGGLIEEYFTREVADKLIINYRRCIQTGTTISYEESFWTKGGERYFYTTLVPLKDDSGQIFRIIGMARDITERKIAEKILKESEDKFRGLVNNVKLGIFRSTPGETGKFLEVNAYMEEITGYSRDELLSMDVSELYTYPEDRGKFIAEVVFSKGKTIGELQFRKKNGTQIIVMVTNVAILNASGRVIYIDGIMEDITGRKKLEEQLKELYEKEKKGKSELQEEAKLRGMFIDVLAHELRTPLTPILSSISTFKDLPGIKYGDIQNRLIDNIYNSSQILSRRLEELLDLARYSRGTFQLNIQPIDLEKYLRDVIDRFRPSLQERGQKLVEEYPESLTRAEIDSSRLEQVIINLLSNASKFSQDGDTIFFRAVVKNHQLQIDVKDHGIGISLESQETLFQPYQRIKQDRQLPGLGLGLTIARQIIEAHGGKIWLVSQPGQGSTFSFRMPLEIPKNIGNC